ncbi:MAG: GNAT family N-acetyltransferase [Halopenitus sp.]
MPGPRVTRGERVSLRTLEVEDVPFHQRGCTNPEIRYPIGNPVRNQEQFDIAEDDGSDNFVVCLDGDDAGPGDPALDQVQRIGMVHVDDVDWRRPDLAYWIAPEFQGDGYGAEAVELLIDYVFRTYAHPAVGAVAYDFNDASRGLLESLGFSEEGCIRRDRFIDGEYIDRIEYGLLREEWE